MEEFEFRFSKYLHRKGDRLGIPISGTFEITRRCNFDCKMCYVHTHDTSKDIELTADEWLKIAADAKKEGLLFLLLTGGEPLIRKDFPYLYSKLSEMGFVIDINTNGSLIDDDILELFKNYPPCRINLTLYGADNDIYESLCGNRKFSVVLENIKRLKSAGISVLINCSLSKYNVNQIEKIYKISEELGIHIRSAAYMFPSMRSKGDIGNNDARLDPMETAKANILCRKLEYPIEKLRANAKDYQWIDGLECDDGTPAEKGVVRCRAGRSSFWVNYDGTMSPCGMLVEPIASLKEMSFKEAWDKIRAETLKIRLPAECTVCKYKDVCHACAAMCYTETGAFDKVPKFICEMTKNLSELYQKEFLADKSDISTDN